MDKEYFLEQYHLAMLDFKTAKTEDEQWDARKRMAGLERTASELYGWQFADELRKKENLD